MQVKTFLYSEISNDLLILYYIQFSLIWSFYMFYCLLILFKTCITTPDGFIAPIMDKNVSFILCDCYSGRVSSGGVVMRWSTHLVLVVGAAVCLLGEHDGVRGQVPLPTIPHEAIGGGSHGGVPQSGSVGVPLPPLGHGQATAAAAASGRSSSHAPVGIPLPTVNPELVTSGINHPVIVPLDPGAVGVPLPPYQHVGPGGVTGGGLLGGLGAQGGLRAVNDPSKDEAVRRVSGLASVRERLQKETREDNAVKITNIITAHKQVVAGQLVYLSAKVSETKCPIGTPDLSACLPDPTEDDHVCEIVVWERPWLNSSKIIDEKTRCVDAEDDVDFDAWGPVNRLGSSIHGIGSEISIPNLPDHIDEKQMSIEAFNYVDSASDSKFRGELVSYDIDTIMLDPVLNQTKVRVKVEYGFTYCIKWVGRTEQRLCPHNPDHDHYVCSVTVVDNPNEITSLNVMRDRDDDIPCVRKREVQEELVIPVRAPCLGCPQAAPLTDPTILEIADFALTEYDRTSDDDDLHMVLKLIKAQTQVVAGIKYYLTMEIAETTCKKFLTGVDVNRTFCHQDPTEETKFCDIIVIEQAWIPTRDLVDARCTDSKSYGSSTVDEFIVPIGIGGGLLDSALQAGNPLVSSSLFPEPTVSNAQNRNIVGAEAQQLAELVAMEYNRREDDDDEYYKVVKVHEATATATGGRRLVVELGETYCNKRQLLTADAGINCQLDPTEETEVCITEIADPLNAHTITSFHCQDMDDYLVNKMSPSLSSFHVMEQPFLNFPDVASQGLPGGMQPQNTENREIKDLANYVAQQYNLRSDDDELYILTNIISAHSQVVSGGKFLLEVEVSESHCKKYQLIADSSRCPLAFDEEPEVCQAEIMVGANQQRELTRLYCDDRNDYYTNKILRGQHSTHGAVGGHSGFTGALTGGWSVVDVNDTKLHRLAMMVADEFDLRSDEENIFVVHHLVEAKQQVVSGMNYHLVIELAETVCPKYKTSINKARCHVDIGEEHMVCEAKIWEQSWVNKLEVTDLRCAEKEDFTRGDDSVEILFPQVHPTSHARPVFLNRFFRDNSLESDESNERFYIPGSGGRSIHRHDDSDEDDSDELPSFSRHRGKRSVGSSHRADPQDPKVQKLAEFSINTLDALGDDPRRRVVTEVISAKKKVVSGLQWSLRILVTWTSCMKDDPTIPSGDCPAVAEEPQYICDLTVFEKPWVSVKPNHGGHFRKVTEANCKPITTPSQ